jgi:disulfide bond formation protein DsbB
MAFFTSTLNLLVSIGILVMQIIIVAIIVWFFLSKNRPSDYFLKFLSKNAYILAFLVTLCGMALSLVYSDVIGYAACTLCWYQRILLYPEVFLLGLALWKGDRTITDYIIALSGLGIVLSAYQKYLEFGGISILPCSIVDVSCSKIYVLEFGYITIPVMALTSFIFIFVLMLIHNYMTRRNSLL